MKLLLDMNLAPRWEPYLRERGWPAEHWVALGEPDADDATIMAFARQHGHVIVTNDLDFGTLLALSDDSGPSVVLLRASVLAPESIGVRLTECLVRFQPQLEKGALVVFDDLQNKLRLLPIGAKR